MADLIFTLGRIEDQVIKVLHTDVVEIALPVVIVAHPDLHEVHAVDPVQVADGNGRESDRGLGDQLVAGD